MSSRIVSWRIAGLKASFRLPSTSRSLLTLCLTFVLQAIALPVAIPQVPLMPSNLVIDGGISTTTSSGNVYYVATNGSDSYSCSQARSISTPKRNITGTYGGMSCLTAGATLAIRGGTYREDLKNWITRFAAGTASAPVTIRGHEDETVELGMIAVSPSVPLSYWIFDNLIINGTLTGSNPGNNAFSTGNMQYVVVQNSTIKNGPRMNIQGAGSNNLFRNVTISDAGKDNMPHYDYGVYWTGSNTVFERIKLYNSRGYGFHIFKSNATNVSNNIVRNSVIYNNGGTESSNAAILLSCGSGNQAYNNLIYGNNKGIQVFYRCTNCLVSNNTIYANRGISYYGIDVSADVVGTVIKNNIILANGMNGINNKGSSSTLANNHCDSSGPGCITTGDPLFVDAPARNFELRAGSPAIDKGTPLPQMPAHDIDGTPRPQKVTWDIGAHEYK